MAKKKKKEIETGRILGRINDDGSITPFIQKQQEEIAPVKDTWLKKGALNDSGYAIQNPLDAINRFNASILMTGVDALGQFGKGFLGSAEGVSDIAKTTTADVLDFFGADNKAKKLRKSAEKQWGINEELDKSLIDDNGFGIDDMSLLGQKGKSVPQGLGTTMFSMTTGSVLGGAGGMALLGLSAAGNSEQEAIKEMKANQDINGFSDKEIYKNAKLYGLLSGTAEAATEMMFGAAAQGSKLLGIGTGAFDSADDAVINALTKKISNKLVKTFTQAGLKASSEGIEEVASGMLDALAKKITYQKDKKYWTELLKDENLLDSFLSGTFSAALSQAPSVARNVTTTENGKLRLQTNDEIRDFITNLNAQEQQVVEREIENRLGQEEKVTKKRRAEIQKQVIEDLDRGYINANTIRDVLGDNYNAERDVRLNESFNEETRRTQAYENDLSKYDEKQRKTIQTAIDSGLLNNSNKTHDFVDLIAKLSADKGIDFDFTNNERIKDTGFAVEGKTVNGFIKDGKVTLNLESNQALNKTVGHEITHVLEGTDLYNNLQDSLKSFIGEREWNNRISELEKTYKNVKGTNIENELTSDLVGEYVFNDESFVKSLSTRNPNLFQKIFDEIKYMVKIATAGSKEARDLEKVKRAFEKAYRESSKTQQGTQYSMSERTDNTQDVDNYIKEKGFAFKENGNLEVKDLTDKQIKDLVKLYKQTGYEDVSSDYLTERLKSGQMPIQREVADRFIEKELGYKPQYDTTKIFEDAEGNPLTKEQVEFYKDSGVRDIRGRLIPVYHRTNADFTVFDEKAGTQHGKKYGKGFYFSTTPENYGNNTMKVYLNAKDGEFKYVPKMGYYIVQEANQIKNVDNKAPTSNPDIRYSLTDNQGRQLSKEQQEYFKDSKLRNENGELEVVYHTSPNQFTVFDNTKLGENTEYSNTAFGFFVTPNKNFSQRFGDINQEGTKGNTMEMYANITNPITHPFYAGYKYEGEQLDNIVREYMKATGNEQFISDLEASADEEGLSLYQTYMDMMLGEDPFETADFDREELIKNGYDAVEFVEGLDKDVNYGVGNSNEPVSSYAVFDSNQLKNTDNTTPTSNQDIRYSLTDNQGRQLSEQQQEFFKDSKVRDDNGNLMVMYHGTASDFTIFDKNKIGNNTNNEGFFGKGFYFTNLKRIADDYSNYKPGNNHVMEEYLNITNPFNWNSIKTEEQMNQFIVDNNLYEEGVPLLEWNPYQQEIHTIQYDWKSRALTERLKEAGYDGVIYEYRQQDENHKPVQEVVVFESNQIKNVDNTSPTTNEDIRYSISKQDSQGRELSKEQQEYFKDSKVRDDDGNLKVMYHGTPDTNFTIFENNRANSGAGLKGLTNKGFYFTDTKLGAEQYAIPRGERGIGETPGVKEVYLNMTNPLVVDSVSKEGIKQIKDFFGIKGNKKITFNNIDNYVNKMLYDDAYNLRSEEQRQAYFNSTGYDGVILKGQYGDEYVVFNSNQIKNVDNLNPTSNPDIRYSLTEDANGNEELTLYHGTSLNAAFKIQKYGFVPNSAIGADGGAANYNYFTNSRINAETYRDRKDRYSGQLLRVKKTADMQIDDRIVGHKKGEYDFRTQRNVTPDEIQILTENGYWTPISNYDLYTDTPADQKVIDKSLLYDDDGNKVSDVKYSLSEAPKQDNQGRELTKNQQEFYKNVSPEVRDENGNLMSFYHGSNSEFTIFDITKSGESSKEAKVGFWFTPNKKGAENFANEVWYGDKTPTTYEVYLNIKNPKVYETYEVDQQQRDNMIQNRKNIEQEIRESSRKYSWTETGDYKVTSLYNDLVEMNRREKNGIRFKEDAQYNEEFYRRLAEERNISNEKFNEMNQDAKNQVELETQKKIADDEFYSYVFSDAYEQFKTDLYLSAGMRAEDANVGGMGMMMKNENEAVANFVEGLKQEGYDGIVIKNTHYDNDSLGEGKNNNQYVAFYPNQIKNVTNENPTDNDDIRYQLGTGEIAPTSGWNVRSEDVRLQSAFKDTIAPLQEQVQQLTDTITRLEDRIAPVEETAEKSQYPIIDKINDFLWKLQGKKDKYYGLLKPDFITEIANEERQQRIDDVNNLIDNLSKKITDSNNELNINDVKDQLTTEINNYIDEYRPLTEQEGQELAEQFANEEIRETAPIRNNLTEEENRRMDMLELLERNNMMNDERRYEKEQLENKINPVYPTEEATPGQALSDIRDAKEIGSPKIKAYQYEHPEVKPYFQEEARRMLSELNNSTSGSRYVTERTDSMYGDWHGIRRFTSPEIAALLDGEYGAKYQKEDIRKGLNAIIEDHGAENIAVAKRIELVLDERLRNGYDAWGVLDENGEQYHVAPNTEYLNMLAEQEWQNYFDDINSQYPLEQLQEPQYNLEDEETDFSDVKIDKDLQDMTVDDLNLEPFLQGLVKADERQKARQEIAKEVGNRKEYTPKKKGLIGKAIDLYKSLTNEFAVVDKFAKDVKNPTITHKIDTWNNYVPLAQTNITKAQTDINGKAIGRSVDSIWNEADDLGVKEILDEYLKHWSNVDRGKRGKGALDYSAKESYKRVQEIKEQHPEVHRLAKDCWQLYRNARHNLRDAGTISQQQSDAIGRANPHYNPFISENLDAYFTETGELKPRKTIKSAKGGAELEGLLSSEEAMKKYMYSQFDEATGNRAFLEIVKSSPNQFVLGGDDRTSYVNQDHLSVDKNGYYLTAYENGEPITAQISKEMYDSLSRQTKHRVDEFVDKYESILKPIEKFGNLRRKMLTELSPSFLLKNPGKDFQEAVINSKYTKDMIANYMNPQTWIELAKGTGEADIFMNNYGSGLVMGQYDIDISKIDPKSKNFNFLKKLGKANEYMELITRYAEFKASRQNGASIQEAMYNAREVTTNFSRGNPVVKAFNKYGMTFLNSSVQGFDKFIRNFSGENGAKGIVNSLAKAAIFGIAPAVFNELAFGSGDDKDEEYEALPDYIKDNYYIIKLGKNQGEYDDNGNVIKIGGSTFLRIPKGRVLSVFGSAARRTIEAMEGEKNAFEGYWNNVQQQIGINNPEENNIFAPLIQAMGGRKLDSGQTAGSAWYGGDIIPTRLQKEHPEDQYDASIDKFSIWLGQKTGISPYKINYVLDQYTGGIGDIGLPMITEEANSDGSIIAPIKDQFTADTITDNKYVSEFYDTYNKIYTGSKKTDEDVLQKNYMTNISKQMGELYAERREIQADTTLSKKEKYEKAQAIKAEINRLAKEGLDNYENISVTGDYADVDGQEYQRTDDEWRKLSSNTSDEVNSLGLTNREKNNYIKTQQNISSIKKKYKDTDDYVGKKQDIIGEIINTNLTDDAKMSLYQDTYKDKFSNYATDLGFDADTYLEYKAQDFSADKDKNGKSISGSKKRKVFDYVNSMDIPYEQKLLLVKSEYNSFNNNNVEIIEYIENSGMDYDERIELYKALGFKVDGDSISW